MPRRPNPPLSRRPATVADAPFLRALYAETRTREMAATGWPDAVKTTFLQGQFDAQQRSYRQDFPDAAFDVLLARGEPVGRLYVARRPDAVTVIDITLSAATRGRGWGTGLLNEIIAEAGRLGVPVRLHVDAGNRAQRLYRRLGFLQTGREGFYVRMERPPGGPSTG